MRDSHVHSCYVYLLERSLCTAQAMESMPYATNLHCFTMCACVSIAPALLRPWTACYMQLVQNMS